MRILFLDDNPNRHEFFQNIVAGSTDSVDYVWTAAECIEKLDAVDPMLDRNIRSLGVMSDRRSYDLVCLDHDLGGKTYVEEIESTGTEVAIFIAEKLSKEKYPKKIIIHSWNPKGSERMRLIISKTSIPVVRKPFSV